MLAAKPVSFLDSIQYDSFSNVLHCENTRLKFPELIEHLSVHQGNMEFEYGPLSLAMKYGGLFLLNEIDLLEPSTAAGLNGILDGHPLCIPENGGELILPHPMFRFAATANSNGGSDETGLYQGVLRQNTALMDRFWLCEVGYPAAKAEERLLAKLAPQRPQALCKKPPSATRILLLNTIDRTDSLQPLQPRFRTGFASRRSRTS